MSSPSQPKRAPAGASSWLGTVATTAGVAVAAAFVTGTAQAAGGRLPGYPHSAVKQRAFQSLLQAP